MENIIYKNDVSTEHYTKKESICFMMNNLHEAALLCRCGKNGIIAIIDFNQAACRFLGFEHDDLKNKPVFKIFTPQSVPLAKGNLNSIRDDGDYTWEAEVYTKTGQIQQVEITKLLPCIKRH